MIVITIMFNDQGKPLDNFNRKTELLMEKYIVYLTKNTKDQINGINRIYIGVHKTSDPEIFDGYIGCGVYINCPSTYMYPKTPFQYAVKKYGVKAFVRQTLFIYDNATDAYKKEAEIVDLDFLKLDYTYNACLGGTYYCKYKSLYQFDLKGNLMKKWEYSKEAYEFYGLPMEKFEYAIHGKHPLLNSFWSSTEKINISEFSTKTWGEPKVTHLYSKNGKWLAEFESQTKCAEYIGATKQAVCKGVANQNLIKNKYYVTNYLTDLFIPKPRIQYSKTTLYVYNKDSVLLFKGVGKEIMPILELHSWKGISDIFRYKHGWYKEFYISTKEIDKVPEIVNKSSIKVDVYDKYGNFIETLDKIKDVREKYKVPSSKIKNIEQGNRYFGEYIFKYHNSK